MTNRQFRYQSSNGGFNILPALLLGLVILMGLFFIARFIFNILMYLAPVLFIITLFIDYKVVLNYGKWLWTSLGQNPIFGVALILLSIVGFPIVSVFLFGKAMLKKKIKEVQQQFGQQPTETYTEYEEVTEEAEWIELPPPPVRQKQKRKADNEYDELFE